MERIVIVGAGLAGLRAAERFRELGFEGQLVIVGAERGRPYHRPALSKQLLTGELRGNDLTLRSYVELDAQWRPATMARRLDVRRRVVELPGEEELRYDGLVIATGVEPRHLPGAARHDPRVHMLRTLRDGIAVRRTLTEGSGPVAVIGGGFTSCEVASTLRTLGRDVTLVSRGDVLLKRVFGERMGAWFRELHRSRGVSLVLGTEIMNWIPHRSALGLHLSTGQLLMASCVVLSVGSVPAVGWLRGSGLTIEDGVLCEPTCHVVGAPDVVAAGDVARWPNLRYGPSPQRMEHWLNAAEMGRAAAESLLAGRDFAQPFTPLPRFWSEQHGLRLQAAGAPVLGESTIQLSGKEFGRGVTGYLRRGNLIGLVGLDSPRGMLRWTAELGRQCQPARRRDSVTAGQPTPYLTSPRPACELEPLPSLESAPGPLSIRTRRSQPRPAAAPECRAPGVQ